jgi:putative RecB family exonuclease
MGRLRPAKGQVAVYSHSRLSSFENCPKQFHYRYVERLPVDSESIEAFLGKQVHGVLERLNRFVERGLVPSLRRVLERFRAEWAEHFDAERVRIVRSEMAVEHYAELGERCLGNHYRRHYPFDRDETLGIETHVSFALDGGERHRIQGYVDRIARAPDGAIEIHDYKTGRFVPSQQTLDEDRQLALYQLGIEGRYGAGDVRLVWHYLQRDQLRVSLRTRDQLDALRERTIGLIDRIESEQAFEPRPSALCTWCEFNHLCPAYPPTTSPTRQRDRLEYRPAPTQAAPARSAPQASEGHRAQARAASEVNRSATAQQPAAPSPLGQDEGLEYPLQAPAGRAQRAVGERRSSGLAAAQQPPSAPRTSSRRATDMQPAQLPLI